MSLLTPPVPSPKSTPSDHLDLPVGGKENSNWTDSYSILIQTGTIVIFLSSDRYTRRHVLRAGTNGRAPHTGFSDKKHVLTYPTIRIFNKSFKHLVFWPENLRDFSGFVRRSICTYRELRRPKSNQFQVSFSCFFLFLTPQEIQKPPPSDPPLKPFSLGPCPDDRAQTSVQDSLNESSVRPNPTLVLSKILFIFCQF